VRGGPRAIVVVGAVAALGACSLAVSLDGLRDGASSSDAAVDGSTLADAAPAADGGGVDARNDGVAGDGATLDASRGCGSDAAIAFCDDFERAPASFQGAWDAFGIPGGGSVGLVAQGFDGGSALQVGVPTAASGDPAAGASLRRTWSSITQNVLRTTARVKLTTIPASGYFLLDSIGVGPDSDREEFFLLITGSGVIFAEQHQPSSQFVGIPASNTLLQPGWHVVAFEVDFAATRVRVWIDGTQVVDAAKQTKPMPIAPLDVFAGAPYSPSPRGAAELLVDDFLFEAR
jgi:hypothetical protein